MIMNRTNILSLVIAFTFILCSNLSAKDYYWVAASNGDWDDANNWSDKEAGSGGFGVPGSEDHAYFTKHYSTTCTLTDQIEVGGITFQPDYSGELEQDGHDMTIGTFGLDIQSGTLMGSSGDISIEGFLKIGDDGILDAPDQLICYSGITATGTFNEQSGLVVIDASNVGAGVIGIDIGSSNGFWDLKFTSESASQTPEIRNTGESAISVYNDFSVAGDGRLRINGEYNVVGDINQSHTNKSAGIGSGIIRLVGASDQHVTGSGDRDSGRLPVLEVNKASGTAFFHSVQVICKALDVTSGTVDFDTYGATLVLRPNARTARISGSFTLPELEFYSTSTRNQYRFSNGTAEVTGNLYLKGNRNFEVLEGNLDVSGNVHLENSADGSGDGVIRFMGNGNQVIQGAISANNSSLPSVVIDKSEGLLYLKDNVSVEGNLTYVQGEIEHEYYDNSFAFTGTGASQRFTNEHPFQPLELETVNVSSSPGTVLQLNGALAAAKLFTLTAGCTLDLNSTLTVEEGLTVDGQLNSGNGSIVFSGTANQELKSAASIDCENVFIRSNAQVMLSANLVVNGSLHLDYGWVDLNGNVLHINSEDNGSVNVGNAFFIDRVGGGVVRKNVAPGVSFSLPFAETALAEPMTFRVYNDFINSTKLDVSYSSSEMLEVGWADGLDFIGNANYWVEVPSKDCYDYMVNFRTDELSVYGPPQIWSETKTEFINMDGESYAIAETNFAFVIGPLRPMISSYIAENCDDPMNWIMVKNYDAQGNVISADKQYFDGLGRRSQFQKKNLEKNKVIASQVIYDIYGRPAIQTLPAVSGTSLTYKTEFVLRTGTLDEYNVNHFDVVSTLNNPVAVDQTTANTLGHYYSSNGEQHIDETTYPYTRVQYAAEPGAIPKRVAQPGVTHRMGSGKETWEHTMPVYDELELIFGTDKDYLVSIPAVNKFSVTQLTKNSGIKGYKTIKINAEGKTIVTYENVSGAVIASAFSGLTSSCNTQTGKAFIDLDGCSSIDVHIPEANKSSLKIQNVTYQWGGSLYTLATSQRSYHIYDLVTNTELTEGTDFTHNTSGGAVTFLSSYATGDHFFRIEVQFAAGAKESIEAVGGDFNPVETTYELDYSHWTKYIRDHAGQIRRIGKPRFNSCDFSGSAVVYENYDYDNRGNILATNTEDAGTTEYIYSDAGLLRYSQNSQQRADEEFTFIDYDEYYRMVKRGVYSTDDGTYRFVNHYGTGSSTYTGTVSVLNIVNSLVTPCTETTCSEEVYYEYNSEYHNPEYSAWVHSGQYNPRFTLDKPTRTRTTDGQSVYYGYDQFDRIVFEIHSLNDNDMQSLETSALITSDDKYKSIEYVYEPASGTLKEMIFQRYEASERTWHYLSHDADMRLTNSSVHNGSGEIASATYEYYSHGPLKRNVLGEDLQGLDYIYNARGYLKAINHPSLNATDDPGGDGGAMSPVFADIFGQTLDYHANDYRSNDNSIISSISVGGRFDGYISAIRHNVTSAYGANGHKISPTNETIIAAATDEVMNVYAYDDLGRLASSNFHIYHHTSSTPSSNTSTARTDYKVYGSAGGGTSIAYDANGNIISLNRNAYNSGGGDYSMDYLEYSYPSFQNRLSGIEDVATISNGTFADDFDASTMQYFAYDNAGRLKYSEAEGVDEVSYYHTNFTKQIKHDNGSYSNYYYAASGSKYKAKHSGGGTPTNWEWIISGAMGHTFAVSTYDYASSTYGVTEQPVYGAERIGIYYPEADEVHYEIRDYRDDVRATFKESGVTLEVTFWADYYPFGHTMPGRSLNAGDYRYGQDNTEQAINNTWRHYPLRMYNPLIGQFTSPDPMHAEHSPYNGMANNPINFTDPTGGVPEWVQKLVDFVGDLVGSLSWGSGSPGGGGGGSPDPVDNLGGVSASSGGGASGSWAGDNGGSVGGVPGGTSKTDWGEPRLQGGLSAAFESQEQLSSLLNDPLADPYVKGTAASMQTGTNLSYDPKSRGYDGWGVTYDFDFGRLFRVFTKFWVSIDHLAEFTNAGNVTQASLLNGDYGPKDVLNYGLGGAGLVINQVTAMLEQNNRNLSRIKTKQSLRNIKVNNQSIAKLGKAAKGLGIAGLVIQGTSAGIDYFSGEGITGGQLFDIGVTAVLTFATVTNPALLVGFGIYGVLDSLGAFDDIKDYFGGNEVVIEGYKRDP